MPSVSKKAEFRVAVKNCICVVTVIQAFLYQAASHGFKQFRRKKVLVLQILKVNLWLKSLSTLQRSSFSKRCHTDFWQLPGFTLAITKRGRSRFSMSELMSE